MEKCNGDKFVSSNSPFKVFNVARYIYIYIYIYSKLERNTEIECVTRFCPI